MRENSQGLASSTEIRTLSYQDYLDPTRRVKFVEDLGRAFAEIGFIVIKDHPVSATLQKSAYDVIQRFFDLPLEEKKRFEVKGIGGARGYTPFGKEQAKGAKTGDLKEFFHVGMEVPATHPLKGRYPENVSVPTVPDFDPVMRQLYAGLLDLGTNILRAIAINLKLREDFFDEKVRYGNSILRPIHYPTVQGEVKAGAVRSAAHEDINLISLLIGASSPGLEVLDRKGRWVPIQTQAHEIVVNAADMLQRLTNYHLVSTTHRVVNPPAGTQTSDNRRYSIPFFLHPEPDMSLAALPSCVKEGETPRDPATTANEYLEQRLREIGLYA